MENRPSQADHKLPQTYLDERNTGNTPGGTPRVVNGDSSFTIAVKDLVGARDRLLKTHNAQEYLGLKLKEIAEATGQLKRAQHIAAKQFEEKTAVLPLVGAALGAVGAIAGLPREALEAEARVDAEGGRRRRRRRRRRGPREAGAPGAEAAPGSEEEGEDGRRGAGHGGLSRERGGTTCGGVSGTKG
jgi:hypothetical protein